MQFTVRPIFMGYDLANVEVELRGEASFAALNLGVKFYPLTENYESFLSWKRFKSLRFEPPFQVTAVSMCDRENSTPQIEQLLVDLGADPLRSVVLAEPLLHTIKLLLIQLEHLMRLNIEADTVATDFRAEESLMRSSLSDWIQLMESAE